jgi:hypothetical protein
MKIVRLSARFNPQRRERANLLTAATSRQSCGTLVRALPELNQPS